ncbi:MAG: MscL family protein [Candidatus Pacearchaeota archaeon]
MCGIIKEFMDFLREYKVIGLAVAFIMALAANTLVKSLVDNIIMPLVGPLIPGGNWQTAVWVLGPFLIGWGPFLAAFLNFIILAFAVFLIAKLVLRETKVSKK